MSARRAIDAPQFTLELAERVAGLEYDMLPAPIVERVRHVLLDWAGVTIAGAQEPVSVIVRRVADLETGERCSTILGVTQRGDAQAAALANGTAAHALDFDDSNLGMVGHPSAPIVSAVAAVAEARGTGAGDFIAAVVAGHEVAARAGLAFGTAHYLRGWHSTATVGTLAAAAGAARAMGQDVATSARALGLAATQAGGLRSAFGTMAKPFQAGRAAAVGVVSAQLATAGVTAARDAIEGHQGLAALQAPDFDPARAGHVLQWRFGIEEAVFKPYACCGGAHGAINAVAKAVAGRAAADLRVEAIRVSVSAQMRAVCNVVEPRTGTESKFSLPHAAALVAAGRSCGPSGFTDDAVADPVVAALRRRVRIHDSGAETGHDTFVELTLEGGEVLEQHSDARLPAADSALPVQWGILAAKFLELVEPVLGDDRAAALVEQIARFGTGGGDDSTAQLLEATRPDGGA